MGLNNIFKNIVGNCGELWGKICNFEAEKNKTATCDYLET